MSGTAQPIDLWKPLPANPQAEAAVLGALLANNRAYDRVCEILRPEHFAVLAYGQIYAAIVLRLEAGGMADAVSLKTHFGDALCDNADGTQTPMGQVLAECLTAMVGILNAGEYAQAIVEAWHRRQLIDIGTELVTEAHAATQLRDDGTPIMARDVHEAAEGRLYAVAGGLVDAGQVNDAGQAVGQAIAAAELASKQSGGIVGVASGLVELDALTGGFRKGQLVILGARPSMGKTACALAIAAGAAEIWVPTLFVSLEMESTQIGARLLSGLAKTPGEYADRGMRMERNARGQFVYEPVAQEDWNTMVAVQRRLADPKKFPLVIDECRQRTMASIRSRARQMQRKRGLGLVVIDYLGLVRVPELSRSDNRTLEVSRISADAKALAKELAVPVVLLSQLNRALESREDRRPRLSDLRDSGSLEQDADIVMFLHREHYYLKKEPIKRRGNESDEKLSERQAAWIEAVETNKGRAQLFIDKHRMGPIGTVDLAFNESNGWISNLPV